MLRTGTQLTGEISGREYVEETPASSKPCDGGKLFCHCFLFLPLWSLRYHWAGLSPTTTMMIWKSTVSIFFCCLRFRHLSTFRPPSHDRSFRFDFTPHCFVDWRIFASAFGCNIIRSPSGGSVHWRRVRFPGPVVCSSRHIHCWLYSSVFHLTGPTSSLSTFGYLLWENYPIYYQHGRTQRLRHHR